MSRSGLSSNGNVFLTALLNTNTFIKVFTAGIHAIPVECLPLFVDYIRLSRNLKDLTIRNHTWQLNYNGVRTSRITGNHRSKIDFDNVLAAVRANPVIKKFTLHCIVNPLSIQDLLTGNET
jgi:hypothetical protein